jgi:hypothetical protein
MELEGECWRKFSGEVDAKNIRRSIRFWFSRLCHRVAVGWSRDVSAEVTQQLRRRCDLQLHDVPGNIVDFVERHESRAGQQLRMRLV